MSELWQQSSEASDRFGAQALAYDRYRPKYPEAVFDDILGVTDTTEGTEVIETGAGTGIATEPLLRRGLSVTAVEPSPDMAALAQAKFGGRGSVCVSRFENYSARDQVQLVTAFNAWHWVEPETAVNRVAELLAPGGTLALVWTEVISWGEEPFEDRLAQISGHPWTKRMDHVDRSMLPIHGDPRFEDHLVSCWGFAPAPVAGTVGHAGDAVSILSLRRHRLGLCESNAANRWRLRVEPNRCPRQKRSLTRWGFAPRVQLEREG
jgi:SAM-dependent methyltransferase